MKYIIKNLNELEFQDRKLFGNKIGYLAEAKKKGLYVAEGFAICIKTKDINYVELQQYIQQIVGNIEDSKKQYIVRSSAQFEDHDNHTFPGIYESYSSIKTTSELVSAIKKCYKNLSSNKLKTYRKYLNLENMSQEYFSVLVQEQVEPEFSGVLFTSMPIQGYSYGNSYYIEMVKGHCGDMLQGTTKAHSYVIRRNEESYQIKASDNPIPDKIVDKILIDLGNITQKIIDNFGEFLDIEWGYVNEIIVIFQIRPFVRPLKKGLQIIEKSYGMKADAMREFHHLGLFPNKLLIIKAGECIAEIIKQVNEYDFRDSKITVRFSCENKIGLPRFFAKNKNEAIDFIEKNYCNQWATIVHESIEVTNSYELYLDHQKCILEHIPGMWESDSQIDADVWIYDKNKVQSYTCSRERTAKYENAIGTKYKNVSPYNYEQIVAIAQKMYYYIYLVQKKIMYDEPMIFHFVTNSIGDVFFLNKRKSTPIIINTKTYTIMHEVRNKSDLLKWDGKTDILLKINIKRGEEFLLKEFVPFFEKSDAQIYVEFGILSHPAIMLREMGICVLPLYIRHQKHVFSISTVV